MPPIPSAPPDNRGAPRKWRPGGRDRSRQRSYEADVLRVIDGLRSRFDVVEYGRLDYAPDSYPLFAIRSRDWHDELPVRAGDRRRAWL